MEQGAFCVIALLEKAVRVLRRRICGVGCVSQCQNELRKWLRSLKSDFKRLEADAVRSELADGLDFPRQSAMGDGEDGRCFLQCFISTVDLVKSVIRDDDSGDSGVCRSWF